MLNWLLKLLLDYIIGKLAEWAKAVYAKFQRKEKIKKDAGESVKPLDEAKTGEEIDEASDEALNGL